MKKMVLLVLVAGGLNFGAKAQTEYLVTVDPATGAFTKVNSIPGVEWVVTDPNVTTIESTNNHFIFEGQPSAHTPTYLYSLDNSNGDIITDPVPPSPIYGLFYGDSSKIFYGIEAPNRLYYLDSVNIKTGSYGTINTLNNDLMEFYEMTYNHNLNELIIYGADTTLSPYFFIVDGITGNMISKTPTSLYWSEIHFDNTTNTLLGIQRGNSPYINEFGIIDIATGRFSALYDFPSDEGLEINQSTFDEKDQQYIAVTIDTTENWHLYFINAATGKVIYKDAVETPHENITDNVINYRYDNTTNILYALHWEVLTTPVTLLSFTATKQATQNLLQWATTQEMNSSYFAVQRSSDGVNFTTLGQVNAVGNSSATHNYIYTDTKPASGTNYYRLKMVDKDGKFTFSQIRTINETASFAASIYPNPVQNNLSLNFNSDKAGTVHVEIVDNEGKVVAGQEVQVAGGASTQSINTASLSNGAYYVRLISAEGETELKFVKGR